MRYAISAIFFLCFVALLYLQGRWIYAEIESISLQRSEEIPSVVPEDWKWPYTKTDFNRVENVNSIFADVLREIDKDIHLTQPSERGQLYDAKYHFLERLLHIAETKAWQYDTGANEEE